MATALRCLTILAAIALAALLLTPTLHATTGPQSSADLTLLNAANRDRAAAGLPPLHWDANLAAAAHQHALLMAQRNALSHQFPGEPPVQDRARHAGARFSLIAENVAEGPSIPGLHTQWMNSAPHRANLMDRELDSLGVSVVQSGNMYFAVEDFSTAVPSSSLEQQEQQVVSQLVARGLQDVASTADARRTCELDRGYSGQRPSTVMRYETADLRQLPDDINRRLTAGEIHSAAIGACEATTASDFTRYRIAILLY
ncbi:MAG TPA: CAP domain-containing protein [Candidatus Saccharimonadales bacterium]|nr:CAP domain-containing protein [Candidatus Saccharimonadales bacterium]